MRLRSSNFSGTAAGGPTATAAKGILLLAELMGNSLGTGLGAAMAAAAASPP